MIKYKKSISILKKNNIYFYRYSIRNNYQEMGLNMVENIKVIKDVLNTILLISGRKTTQSHAVYLLGSTLNNLKKQHSFLDNITVKDTTYLEDSEPITIMGNINELKINKMGPAVKDIITHLNNSLGDEAGHFFLKELSQKLDDESINVLKEMGVDLELMHLEQQISKMEKDIFK